MDNPKINFYIKNIWLYEILLAGLIIMTKCFFETSQFLTGDSPDE
jgi:hypothetical protein